MRNNKGIWHYNDNEYDILYHIIMVTLRKKTKQKKEKMEGEKSKTKQLKWNHSNLPQILNFFNSFEVSGKLCLPGKLWHPSFGIEEKFY